MSEGTTRLFMLASVGQASTLSVGLLAMGLNSRWKVEVGVLGSTRPSLDSALEQVAVPVHRIPQRHAMDLSGLRRLRNTIALFRPDIIHCWDPAAAKSIAILRLLFRDCRVPALVVSGCGEAASGLAAWTTSRALPGADRIAVATRAEAGRCRKMGVAAERLTVIPPGVAVPPPPPDRNAFCREMGVPISARFIATAGRLEPNAGMKAAVWAFDMLRYEFPDLHLLIFGEGPGRAGIERFGRSLGFDDFRIRFPGSRADFPSLLRHAEAVWVMSVEDGPNLAVQGMAAGRPVVAWDTSEMAEIVEDGTTGLLAPAGDRVQLAARTHALLSDSALGSKVGAAGLAVASHRHGVEQMIARCIGLYESLHAER